MSISHSKRQRSEKGDVQDLTNCPFKKIASTYLDQCANNRSKGDRQNRLFYSMSPVGHRFLENIDSNDLQFPCISQLARQFNRVLEENAGPGFETRLQTYWKLNPPDYPVCSLRDTAFGAVLNEVWDTFFGRPCPQPDLVVRAAHNILMVVKDWDVVDLTSRQQALSLVAKAVQQGLNPRLQVSRFHHIHEVIFALMVSAVDELSEGFAHTLLCLVQSDAPLPSNNKEFVLATYEALRLYPLFTASTRPDRRHSRLYTLNYVRYHRRRDLFGDDADLFDWQRWRREASLGQTLIFGVSGNRACPGRSSAVKLIPAMVRTWMRTYHTRAGIPHCRQLPCGGLAIAIPSDANLNRLHYWLHLGAWACRRGTFWLGIKWWVKAKNLAASRRLREADRYYETLPTEPSPSVPKSSETLPSEPPTTEPLTPQSVYFAERLARKAARRAG